MPEVWVYPHQDLGEPVHIDGSPVPRPVVPLILTSGLVGLSVGLADTIVGPISRDDGSTPLGVLDRVVATALT